MTLRKTRSCRAGAGACLLLALISVAWATTAGAGSIDWRTDLPRALAEARSRNCPLWIQFTGPWCHYCHLMDRVSFVHPKIVDRSRTAFVPIKLQSDQHEDLTVQFAISGLPSSVIVAPSGALIAKHEGYADPETFGAFLESSLERFSPPAPAPPLVASIKPKAEARARKAEAGVALAGYCPVSLVQEHRLVPGQDAVSLRHEGRLYRFANPSVRDAFQTQPERFVPVNRGLCPVSQIDRGLFRAGDPKFGVLLQGHLYLCADEPSRQEFLKHPERYLHVDLAERGFCPHCWGRDRLVVRGPSPYPLTRADARSIFPLIGQLESYRTAETARR